MMTDILSRLRLTARTAGTESAEYCPPDEAALRWTAHIPEGDGSLEAPWTAQLRIENAGADPWRGVIHIQLECPGSEPKFFLPGFLYGRNRGEAPIRVHNAFPRLRPGAPDFPAASWWMVRGDRLSHPAAFAYGGGRLFGVCASPYFLVCSGEKVQWEPGKAGDFFQYAGFTCSLAQGTVGYTLGYENAPWLFVQSHNIRERAPLGNNCFQLEAGESVSLKLCLFDVPAEGEQIVYRAVERVYGLYHEPCRRIGSVTEAVADIAAAVSADAWLEEERSYAGFVFDPPVGGETYRRLYSLSWTNGLAVAVPMLLASLRLGDEEMRRQALSSIDYIVENSINPATGLPYCAYHDGVWSNRGWWFDGMRTPGHSAYLIGQGVWELLKAYAAEKTARGVDHAPWLSYASSVLSRVEPTKNTDGEYPFILSEATGAGLEYDALGSAWCLAAAACYSFLSGERDWLDGLIRSENHYYRAYVAKAECYGGPLDTDKAVDSEGVLAYIRAAAYLHRLTGESVYLDHMRDALCYEFTFKFCYNSPVRTPPLGEIGWSSCGGSITSVANPHIHPMSASVIDEMFYYLSQRDDPYVRSRLRDTVRWCCQTYNRHDGEYGYGKKGWMSERFCHCEGLLVQTYPDGSTASTWFALMPWACGSVLEGLCGTCYDSPAFFEPEAGKENF